MFNQKDLVSKWPQKVHKSKLFQKCYQVHKRNPKCFKKLKLRLKSYHSCQKIRNINSKKCHKVKFVDENYSNNPQKVLMLIFLFPKVYGFTRMVFVHQRLHHRCEVAAIHYLPRLCTILRLPSQQI